jgi:hypothetical protein
MEELLNKVAIKDSLLTMENVLVAQKAAHGMVKIVLKIIIIFSLNESLID